MWDSKCEHEELVEWQLAGEKDALWNYWFTVTLSTKIPTDHLEVNLGLRDEKPLTNQHLSYFQDLWRSK